MMGTGAAADDRLGADGEPEDAVGSALARTHREEWTLIVAGLARTLGDLDAAEDAAAEAFAVAAARWPEDGVPDRPAAWVTTVARRRAIDRLRRERLRERKHREALQALEDESPVGTGSGLDDRLRLLVICCDPVLSEEARIALTLRVVAGLSVEEIAREFLVRPTTMGQRISRAKAAVRSAGVPFREPGADTVRARVPDVLHVLLLVFHQGHLSTTPGTAALRTDLTEEAIRLARLVRELQPEQPEPAGLLSQFLLAAARSPARLSADGELVPLPAQDRSRWDRARIAEGLALLDRARAALDARGEDPGRYVLMAGIHAVHAVARHPAATDWEAILGLYERLGRIDPGPVVALNTAIALAEARSPEAGLARLAELEPALDGLPEFHGARAEMLSAGGRREEAAAAFERASDLATHPALIAHLTRRRQQSTAPPGPGTPAPHPEGEPR